MKALFGFIKLFCACALLSACAQEPVETLMERYLWTKRVLLIFAPAGDNTDYSRQNAIMIVAEEGLAERDMVIWRLVENQLVSVDGKRMAQLGTPAFYSYFNVTPEVFTVILLGKDGEEKLRQHEVLSSEKLFQIIDAMPMRQQEM